MQLMLILKTSAQSKNKSITKTLPPPLTANQLHQKQNICPDKNPTFLQMNLFYIWISWTSYTIISTTGSREHVTKILYPFLIKRKTSPSFYEESLHCQGPSWIWEVGGCRKQF